ncbi:Outer membrane protein beta-barrel domain-containing protein [Reichenbachiella agariperforans]|uniref:Outer membrane protein beta-barrel domain-containing protein n=1 Tax=Reichenbachiella agariperforans TaxID=156994 RepID=A0A1M6NNZ8_REIAG|nr:porin family protein [Reichenbachiella agariperforans]SHJ97410.1 Outer membrane protein beta-barrel domain-containing protein [Reichenbachiella agariperforans]
MKKCLALLPLLFSCVICIAQPNIGLTVSPGFSFTRTTYQPSDDSQVSKGDMAFRAKFGLEIDFPITETYAFSTGILFAPKKISVVASDFDQITTSIINQKEEYKAQYLQIPATLKLFTSEIQPDLRLFFQLGFMGEILLYDQAFDKDYIMIEKFRFFDFSFTGGIGVEYGAEINTRLYAGVFYDRGLVNVVRDQNDDLAADLSIRMDMLHLKVGVKF